jgi:hypothetical protein
MNKIIALAFLIVGIVLIIYGVAAHDSFGGRLNEFFTGSPTDETIWLLIGGIIAAAIGATNLLRGTKAN